MKRAGAYIISVASLCRPLRLLLAPRWFVAVVVVVVLWSLRFAVVVWGGVVVLLCRGRCNRCVVVVWSLCGGRCGCNRCVAVVLGLVSAVGKYWAPLGPRRAEVCEIRCWEIVAA